MPYPATWPPSLKEVLATARVVSLPMRTRFRGVTARELLLLRGPAGWGEFGPFLEYDDAESARWLAAALEAAWVGWPEPTRLTVPVNATVPAVNPAEVAAILDRFPGCRTAKVKVGEPGQSLAQDVDRVAAVRDHLGPGGRLRVDANGAWSVDDAGSAIPAIAAAAYPATFEYVEQPCRGLDELAALRRRLARAGVDVRLAADESIRKAADPLRVAELGAADVVVLKAAPMGGVAAAVALAAALRERHDVDVVASSALDSSVGLAAGVALAAALPALPYACGLGTAALLAADVAAEPLLPVGGTLPVRTVAPDADLMTALAAPPERRDWWLGRLARCHALLGA